MFDGLSVGLGIARLLFDIIKSTGPEPLPETVSAWTVGQGSYIIHEQITEAQACHKAENKAKLNAIQTFSGEFISSDTTMTCSETGGNADCPAQTFTWSKLNGLIISVRNKSTLKVTNLKEQRVCKVNLEAKVSMQSSNPDANFDMSVNLQPSVLREGEPIKIGIEPTQKMHIYIYAEETKGKLIRIFPNPFDKENEISNRITLPGTPAYSIRATYDDTMSGSGSQEVVHILGSKNKLSLLSNYTLEDFNLKMIEIPNNQKRYIRKGYRVVK